MRKTTKSLASLLLVMTMVFTMIPASLFTASAADTVLYFNTNNDFTFKNTVSDKWVGNNNVYRAGQKQNATATSKSTVNFEAGTQYTFTLDAGFSNESTTRDMPVVSVGGTEIGQFAQAVITDDMRKITWGDNTGSIPENYEWLSTNYCFKYTPSITYTPTTSGAQTVVLTFKHNDQDKVGFYSLTISDGSGEEPGGEVEIGSIQSSTSWTWTRHQIGTFDFSGYTNVRFEMRSLQGQCNKLFINGTEHYVGKTSLNGNLDGQTYMDVTGESEVTFEFEGNGECKITFYGVSAGTTHTVTAQTNNAAYGTVTGGGTYEEGSSVTVTATPNEGYKFLGWYNGDDKKSEDASYKFEVTGDIALEARFAKIVYYTVTTTTNNANYGSVTAGNTYEAGTQITLTATPNEGYKFLGWYNGNDKKSEDASYTFDVTENIALEARFAKIVYYTVTTTTNNANYGSVTAGNTYEAGTQITLTATPNEGYKFLGWYNGNDKKSEDASYTFDVTENIALEARFAEIVKYTVTVESANTAQGTVTGGGTYEAGTQATVTATANTGYAFKGWYVDGSCKSADASYTFEVTGDIALEARFAKIVYYTVTVESANTAQGAVTGGGTYEAGTQATVIATANTGYAFKGWYVDDSCKSEDASYTFVVDSNITLTATFEEATTTDTIRLEGENATHSGNVTVAIPNENVTVDSTSEGLVALFGDGSDERIASFDVEIPVDGKYTFTFRAVGLGSESRNMRFFIDDAYENVSVSNSGWTDFVYEVELTAGTHTIGAKTGKWGGNDSWRWEWLYFDYVEIKAEEPVFEYVAPSYTVNANVDGHGTVAVTPEQDTFEQGSKVTVTVTPVEGYSVAYWIVNGKQVSSTSNTYTIEAIDRNYTIEAKLTNTYKVTTTVKAADKEHPYAFAEIELPESVFPQLYVEENWKNGFNITCSYNLTDYIFNGKAEAVFAVKTSSGKYYYQQSTHNLANTTITIPNCWYDPDDKVVSVILLVTAISPAQNDFLENGDALVDLSMDFTVYDVVTRDIPYVDLSNKTDNYIIYGNEIPVTDLEAYDTNGKPFSNQNGDSKVTFETVIDELNEFEHRVWEIKYEFDREGKDEDDGGTTGGVYAGRYYVVPNDDVHVDATGGSGFSFYYRTEVSNTEGIWITLQSNLFATHEQGINKREPLKVYLEPTGGEWEACFVAYNLNHAAGKYITYWDFFVDGSNPCIEANGTYTYVDPKVYGDGYITKMSADSGTFWFTELRLERYSNIVIEYKDMFGKLIERRVDKVATIQDPPDFVERKGYDFLYWTYNGEIVGEYWTDNTTGEYVTPGSDNATPHNDDDGNGDHFDQPVTESRIYVAMYKYNGDLYKITVTNGAITNVSTQPVTEAKCRYETVLRLEAAKKTSEFAYWVYGDYKVDENGNKIGGTEKYSILSYKESIYTSVMGHADYIAVYKDDIKPGADFIPAPLLAYYSPDKTGNGATYFTSAADMKLYTSIFNRAEVFDSYHDKEHNKISFLGTIAYDEKTYKPLGWGTVVTNNKDAANTVGGADTLLDGGKTSDEMVITYENFLSATVYWKNVGTSKATIQKSSWSRKDVWNVILAGGQYLISYTNLNNNVTRYARTFLVAEELENGAVYMVFSDDYSKAVISPKPETVNINVTIKIDGEAVETTTNGRVVKDEKSGCYTTGSGSVIKTVDGFVRATPAVGYKFLGWDTNGDGTIDKTSTKYEYSKLTANVNLVAFFEKTDTFYVTATVATANAGRIASSVTNNQITAGESVTLYALPNAGFKFLGWYVSHDDVGISYVPTTYTSEDASYTFTPTEDCYAYAYFVEGTNVKTYTVTIGEAEGGSAKVDGETSKSVEYGKKVTLVATPNEGYEFAYWMINSVNGSTESTIEYVVSKNVTITPVFHKSTNGYTDTLTLEAEGYTDAQYVLSDSALSKGTDGDITYSIINNNGAKDVHLIPFKAPADGKYTFTFYYQRTAEDSNIHFDIFTTSSSNYAKKTIDGVTYYETYWRGTTSDSGEGTDEFDSVAVGEWGVKEFPMTLELSAGETILVGLCDNKGHAYFDKVVVKADAKVFEEGLKPTVTIEAENGTVTDAKGNAVESGMYAVGTELELYPVQNSADYIFSHWADADGNILSKGVCYTFTVEADTTVKAVFVEYKSIEATDATGHIKTPAGETVYNVTVGVQNGNTVIVKNYFTAADGVDKEGYYLDTITSAEGTSFTAVDRKLTLTAKNKKIDEGEYNIFLYWLVNGTPVAATIDSNGDYELKTEKLSTYTGYGTEDKPMTIVAVYSDKELSEYTVTVNATNGSVLDGDDNVITSVTGYEGSLLTLYPAPNAGFIFDHWELDGVNVDSDIPYSVLISGNSTLVAVFTEYVSIGQNNATGHNHKDDSQTYYNLTVAVENYNSAVVKSYYSTSSEGYYLDTITSATGVTFEVPADRRVTLTAVDKVVTDNSVNIFVGWYYADGTLLNANRECQIPKLKGDVSVIAKYSTVTSLDVTINYLGASEITYNDSKYTSLSVEEPTNGTTYTFTVGEPANYYEFVGWYAGETLLGTDKTLNYTYNSSNGSVEIVAKFDFIPANTTPIVSIVTSDQNTTEANPKDKDFNAITEKYVSANISVLNAGDYNADNVAGTVKGRGNSTWSSAENNNLKRPIRIKYKSKTSMLGLNDSGEYKSWVLLANNSDRSMYRNALAFELGKYLDKISYTSDYVNVEVYINGVYQGVYLLCEQSQAGSTRNDIKEPKNGDKTEVDALVELDNMQNHKKNGVKPDNEFDAPYDDGDYYFEGGEGFTTAQTTVFTIKSDVFTLAQYNYIKEKILAAQTAIYSKDETTIRKAIDVDSFVDMYILQEIAKNVDVGYSSFYMMLKNGVVVLSNPWDFDKAFGNDMRASGYDGLYVADIEGSSNTQNQNPWFVSLMDQKWFKSLVIKRWKTLYEAGTFTTVANTITADFEAKKAALDRNYTDMWKSVINTKQLDQEPVSRRSFDTAKAAFDDLMKWYNSRIAYINGKYNTSGSTGGEGGESTEGTVSPDGTTLRIEAETATLSSNSNWQTKGRDTYYGTFSGSDWIEMTGESEIYLPFEVTDTTATYTINVRYVNHDGGKDPYINIWIPAESGTSIGGSYFKKHDLSSDVLSKTAKEFNTATIAAVQFKTTGTHYIGLYGKKFAGFDYVEIVASNEGAFSAN